ncbi:MAG: hypothetical protein AB7S26_40030 [Sandaracinaceae bacterium]
MRIHSEPSSKPSWTRGVRRVVLVLATALASCTYSSLEPDAGGLDAGDLPDGTARRDGSARPDAGDEDAGSASVHRYVSSRVEPAEATLSCDRTQDFRMLATRDDGLEVMLPLVDWATDAPGLGTVSEGRFTPRAGCRASGRATITATAPDGFGAELTADATVTVRVDPPPGVEGVTLADAEARFMRPAGAAAAARVVYPLDGVLLPNNIAPIDLQWTGGVEGDVYRITIESETLRVVHYVAHTGAGFGYHWVPSTEAWAYVSENYDGRFEVRVDRWSSSSDTVSLGAPIQMRVARSGFAGAVYYWGIARDSSTATFERINVATGLHEQIIENPPTPSGAGNGCVGCHTVSRDGRFLAANLNGGSGSANEGGALFDLTGDLSGSPTPTVFPTWPRNDRFWFAATFNPDATRLLINSSYAILIDTSDGSTVPATGIPPRDAQHVYYGSDWSPDGNTIVMARYDATTSSWAHLFSHSDLEILPVIGPDAFGGVTVLHRGDDLIGAPEGGRVDVHPSFSPDSLYLAFQHSDWSRTSLGGGSTFAGGWTSSALYMVSMTAGSPIRLDNAVSGVHGHRDYWPTFAPFRTTEPDGTVIVWLAFTSGRDYGNEESGTAAVSDLLGRQIWVTALELPSDELGGTVTHDPSNVPFWLPGQNTGLENLGAYWAGLPCRAQGDGCGVSSECCSEYCAPGGGGALECQPVPSGSCRERGESCGSDGDCCVTLTCISGACVPSGPI